MAHSDCDIRPNVFAFPFLALMPFSSPCHPYRRISESSQFLISTNEGPQLITPMLSWISTLSERLFFLTFFSLYFPSVSQQAEPPGAGQGFIKFFDCSPRRSPLLESQDLLEIRSVCEFGLTDWALYHGGRGPHPLHWTQDPRRASRAIGPLPFDHEYQSRGRYHCVIAFTAIEPEYEDCFAADTIVDPGMRVVDDCLMHQSTCGNIELGPAGKIRLEVCGYVLEIESVTNGLPTYPNVSLPSLMEASTVVDAE